jgi:hypothetical protein
MRAKHMIRHLATVLFFLLACRPVPASEAAGLAAAAIQAAVADARRESPPGAGRGPLFVDLESVQQALGTRAPSREALVEAIGHGARPRVAAEVLQCGPGVTSYCGVSENGVFVRVQGLAPTLLGYKAVTISTTQDLRPSGAMALCERELELGLRRRDSGWTVAEQALMRTC